MNRLALYVFWEQHGNVHDHVVYYLRGLFEVAQDVAVIVNGALSEEGRKCLKGIGVDFFVRENRGIDFAAWKAGLAYVGWDKVRQYDELVLCNCSCYGPAYPFSEVFDRMEDRDCDFWGINRQPDLPNKLIGPDGNRFPMTEHIQSYFYVFRKRILQSEAFRLWWDNLVEARSYWEEIREHELKFSGYLEQAGFVGDTLMDFQKYRALAPSGDAWSACADVQLAEDRNPLVKRKAVFSSTDVAIRVLEHLHYHTDYPVEIILKDKPNRKYISLLNIIKYHVMKYLCSERKRCLYEVKEKKSLFWYYLYLQLK
ncbi:rhamnan synthesis F family protein [uncultured Mailhella sp.]|uniref:rhamnan synthesis F family protein n=1 Tax=uncultured Mailhella sp. TaxID=1981031 RepID=UPI0025DF3EB6|nr:rhamnan synthesis F family protein [uncultured Mailhella sp.]